MSMTNNSAGSSTPTNERIATQPRRKARLWLWFLAGFLSMFVLLAFSVTAMTVQGDGVMLCKLWQYYIIEVRRALGPTNLGPATGSSSTAVIWALQHILFSAAGGAAVAGLRWLVEKIRS